MKLIRQLGDDALYNYLRHHLPSSLRVEKVSSGYGYIKLVYRVDCRRTIVNKMFDMQGNPVAQIHWKSIDLFHPEWLSDFEDIIKDFEKEYNEEVTLKYWEGNYESNNCSCC